MSKDFKELPGGWVTLNRWLLIFHYLGRQKKFAQLKAQIHKLDYEEGELGQRKKSAHPKSTVSVFRNLAWSTVVHQLRYILPFVHNTKLFAVSMPSPNQGKYFCTQMHKAAAEHVHITEPR